MNDTRESKKDELDNAKKVIHSYPLVKVSLNLKVFGFELSKADEFNADRSFRQYYSNRNSIKYQLITNISIKNEGLSCIVKL